MHTVRKSEDKFEVVFVADCGADIVCNASSEFDAMAIASYLNGGSYPPLWNLPLAERQ